MSPEAASFLALCKELRKLGVCKLDGHGFSAVFVPASGPQSPLTPPVDRSPRASKPPKAPTPLTDKERTELREAAYRKELGQA